MPFRAFLDANVLVEARQRDVLLSLAEAGLFDPLWSPLAIEEMLRHLPRSMSAESRAALLAAMSTAFPEAKVEWPGAVSIDVALSINEKDRHIVASAIWARSGVLVTNDAALRAELERSGLLDAQAPAEFVAYAIDVDPAEAREALLVMVRDRWLVGNEDAEQADEDLVLRLTGWMRQRAGWSVAASLLESASN